MSRERTAFSVALTASLSCLRARVCVGLVATASRMAMTPSAAALTDIVSGAEVSVAAR